MRNVIEILITSSAPHFVQENDIFGQSFALEFEWIEREGFWMLHLADHANRPLALGLRLFADWPLYVHHGTSISFALFLQAKVRGAANTLVSLSKDFTLVAYEIL